MKPRPLKLALVLLAALVGFGYVFPRAYEWFIIRRDEAKLLAAMWDYTGPKDVAAHLHGRAEAFQIGIDWYETERPTSTEIRARALDRVAYYKGMVQAFEEMAEIAAPPSIPQSQSHPEYPTRPSPQRAPRLQMLRP